MDNIVASVYKREYRENLEVSTDAPENESYAIRIVDNRERNLEAEFVDTGSDVETSFLLGRFDPGTYMIALTQNSNDNRTAVGVEPFIIKAYTSNQLMGDVIKRLASTSSSHG